MILKYAPRNICFSPAPFRYEFTPTGDVRCFYCGDLMISRLTGNSLDGGAANLWLRVRRQDGSWRAAALLGVDSGSELSLGENCLKFQGTALGISYSVTFGAFSCGWRWDVTLSGHGEQADVIYGQDVGLGSKDAVLENDLYLSQYLGHTVLKDAHGYVICSRQNLPQDGKNPCLQIGMLNGRSRSYSTDATQFFGLDYKRTNIPKALSSGLAGSNYQFECAYPALQSTTLLLNGTQHLSFYGYLQQDHSQAVTAPVPCEALETLLPSADGVPCCPLRRLIRRSCFGPPSASEPMPLESLEQYYPSRRLEEWKDGELLSFFTDCHAHVATQAKELLVERPHANILTTFLNTERVDQELITTTCAMSGLFNGQTVIGNTSKHKLLSASRGLLNRMKHSGMRIWAEEKGVYRLLTMPAVFETGLNYCRWIYRMDGDTITVETFAAVHSTDIVTQLSCTKPRRFAVSCQLVMGTHEYQQDIEMECRPGCAVLRPTPDSAITAAYPALCYELHFPEDAALSDDRIFFEDGLPQDTTLLTLRLSARQHFSLRIHGTLEPAEAKPCPDMLELEREQAESLRCYTALLRGFVLEDSEERELQILNETAYWYAHNAMVHFAVPHGLEQPGGAAWGTRDICQGPFAFLMTTQHYALVRDILLTIFRHQNGLTGEWPQWFMFDRYTDEMSGCHGDVVFWPLKCVSDYLAETGDQSLLAEVLPYAHTREKETLLCHIRLALAAIQQRFLPGTALISYAGGDWDDTLQPNEPELQQRLVSSWTQALAYQVLDKLGQVLPQPLAGECTALAQQIGQAFEQYLVIDGVIAGFVCRLADGGFRPMLHPRDEETGIRLRLLPMTRSIIAELSNQALARGSFALIEQKLHAPDGVRLMDHPAKYSGGVSRLFRRAEQAANVGREISLQYTHAHIRYIEAACRLGNGAQAWKALFEVNPICLMDTVPNALPRQSNLYFSSSDGLFPDRWIYDRDYDKLMCGEVPVKGGWRLYSSGPGIYYRRLLCDILGVRVQSGWLQLDPVLPPREGTLRFSLEISGKALRLCYHLSTEPRQTVIAVQQGVPVPSQPMSCRYRECGIRLPLTALDGSRTVDVFFSERELASFVSEEN